jgi:hypothetical protein
MGTFVRDSLKPNLASGVTLNSATSTNGAAWDAQYPGDVMFEVLTATVTGTSPILTVVFVGADDSSFSTNKVTYGRIVIDGADKDNVRRVIHAHVLKRYVRAEVTVAGTSPVYTGTTITALTPYDRYVANKVSTDSTSS